METQRTAKVVNLATPGESLKNIIMGMFDGTNVIIHKDVPFPEGSIMDSYSVAGDGVSWITILGDKDDSESETFVVAQTDLDDKIEPKVYIHVMIKSKKEDAKLIKVRYVTYNRETLEIVNFQEEHGIIEDIDGSVYKAIEKEEEWFPYAKETMEVLLGRLGRLGIVR